MASLRVFLETSHNEKKVEEKEPGRCRTAFMLATLGRSMNRPRNILRRKDHVISRNRLWKYAMVVCSILQTVQRSRMVVPVNCSQLRVQPFRGTIAHVAVLPLFEGSNFMKYLIFSLGLQSGEKHVE